MWHAREASPLSLLPTHAATKPWLRRDPPSSASPSLPYLRLTWEWVVIFACSLHSPYRLTIPTCKWHNLVFLTHRTQMIAPMTGQAMWEAKYHPCHPHHQPVASPQRQHKVLISRVQCKMVCFPKMLYLQLCSSSVPLRKLLAAEAKWNHCTQVSSLCPEF